MWSFESERLKFIYIVRTSVEVEVMNLQSRKCFGKRNSTVFRNQHNSTRYCYTECRYAEYHYAECRYAECRLCSVSKISQLCWVSLCWESLCWVLLCRVSLCWMSLCWVLWPPFCSFMVIILLIYKLFGNFFCKIGFNLTSFIITLLFILLKMLLIFGETNV